MKMTTKWEAPSDGGVPLLTMPNIPQPLHGHGCQPRTIVGKTQWDKMRFACYEEHNETCEICGQKLGNIRGGELPLHQAHEVFSYDFEQCIAKFERLCCLCYSCHMAIHSGRALTMYRNHDPWHTKEYMLGLAEHTFKLIHDWNMVHRSQEPLRVWRTIIAWAEEPSLKEDISRLIDQYDIHFYTAENAAGENGTWNKWKLLYDGEEYHSPYKDTVEYDVQIAKQYGEDTSLFVGPEFDQLRKNIEERKKNESTR